LALAERRLDMALDVLGIDFERPWSHRLRLKLQPFIEPVGDRAVGVFDRFAHIAPAERHCQPLLSIVLRSAADLVVILTLAGRFVTTERDANQILLLAALDDLAGRTRPALLLGFVGFTVSHFLQ